MSKKLYSCYFEIAKCGECGSIDGLLIHRYVDDVLCVECLEDFKKTESEENDDFYGLTTEERNK